MGQDFYAVICGGCGLIWMDPQTFESFLLTGDVTACPNCGERHEGTEPNLCNSAVVLANRDNPNIHSSVVAEAERRVANAGN